jgi:hypothetical protein
MTYTAEENSPNLMEIPLLPPTAKGVNLLMNTTSKRY